MSGQPENLIKNAEEGVKLYNQLKFDVAAEGYKIVDKQILDPIPTCVFCKKTGKDIVGVKVNDNLGKVQTCASLCGDCATTLHGLGAADVENSLIQRMIRFFFESSADKIIKGQYAEKKMNQYQPIYVEYWALLKWSIEEKLLRQLIQSVPYEQTKGFTEVRAKDGCCVCSSDEVDFDSSGIGNHFNKVYLYSPIKEAWMGLELCIDCKKQLDLDLKDMEHEVKTSYFEKYDDYADLPRRESLEIMCRETYKMKEKVLFLDTATKLQSVINILNACGVDEEHQIIKKINDAQEKEKEVGQHNENIQEQVQEPEPSLSPHNNCYDN